MVGTGGAAEAESRYRKLSPGPGRSAAEVAGDQRARIHGAMAELVAEWGYDAVKVREIVSLAGVSTRAFYENFDSKEACFLRTYELIVGRAMRGLVSTQLDEPDWRERPRLIFGAFARQIELDPDAAGLALVAAYTIGPAALEQARSNERALEAMIGESFARTPEGIVVPQLLVEGMAAGIGRVARSRLAAGREAELFDLTGEIMEWMLCYPGESSGRLAELDGRYASNTAFLPLLDQSGTDMDSAVKPEGDRATILASVARVAAARGYAGLTVPRIRARTGVSRAKFAVHFEGVEDCFLAALDLRVGEAIAEAARVQADGSTWGGGVYRAISSFCDQIAGDPILTGLCLADDFTAGSSGSVWRQRMIAAVAGQLQESPPRAQRLSPLIGEASSGAIWALFHHHVVRGQAQHRPEIAATLAFLTLAPAIGAAAAVTAIRDEQGA